MKKLIALFCVASAVTAFADTPAASDNVFGVLRVDSTAEQTIVSIPWEAPGGGAIKVKDAIKTANLTKGDQLYYYDATATTPSYKLWVLGDNGWEGATTVKDGDDGKGAIAASAGGDEMLARGGALILVRHAPSMPFYLYGQYTSSAAEVNLATPASDAGVDTAAYSLIAPPKTVADTDGYILLANATWTNIETTDNIVLPSGQVLNWNGTSWGVMTYQDAQGKWTFEGKWDTSGAKIPMGQGVWFKSFKGKLTGKKVQW